MIGNSVTIRKYEGRKNKNSHIRLERHNLAPTTQPIKIAKAAGTFD